MISELNEHPREPSYSSLWQIWQGTFSLRLITIAILKKRFKKNNTSYWSRSTTQMVHKCRKNIRKKSLVESL
jgi:hypothetical protein